MKHSQGLVEVYTGNGKGKTTAAFGLAMRSVGWGFMTLVVQFMKMGTYGENRSARLLGEKLEVRYVGKPYFIAWEGDIPKEDAIKVKNVRICKRGEPPADYLEMVQNEFGKMYEETVSGKWDTVILDEINVALHYNLLQKEQVIKLIDDKPGNVELVMTGRAIPEEIMTRADLVTEMREVRHPYSKGVPARRGVDF